jgi:hypothetical protein
MEAMEKLSQELEAATSVKDKLKKKYDFIQKIIDKEAMIDLVGKFNDADPNDINIIFDMIINEYDRPYNEHTMQERMAEFEAFNTDGVKAITELSENISKIENLNKANVNARYNKRYF